VVAAVRWLPSGESSLLSLATDNLPSALICSTLGSDIVTLVPPWPSIAESDEIICSDKTTVTQDPSIAYIPIRRTFFTLNLLFFSCPASDRAPSSGALAAAGCNVGPSAVTLVITGAEPATLLETLSAIGAVAATELSALAFMMIKGRTRMRGCKRLG
jgi:hypothetical protein